MKSLDRAEHVGSLLRSPELLQARADFAEGRLKLEQLREIEDRAILDALEKQASAGLDRVTDGEFRRGSWLTDMADAVEGFVRDRVVLDWKGPGGGPEVSSANAVGGKLRKTRHLEHEVPFLLNSSKRPFKVTLPAPSNFVVCSYRPGITGADGQLTQTRRAELPPSDSSHFVPPDRLPFDVARIIKRAIVDWEAIQPLGFTRPTNESSGDYIVAEMESMGLRRLNGETAWFKANAGAEAFRVCVFTALDHWLIAAEIFTKRTPEEMDEYERPLGE